jgi:hypothetical protein
MIIATNIKTALWNNIIELLLNDKWITTYRYDGIDAGIDEDFVILEKENEEILFGWDNWMEGEIKCSEARMKEIENMINKKLEKGQPTNLKPEVIENHRKLKWKIN